ncbi:hypothetical protein THASP1DRAFT_27157 [Thamnocephalis sphaerospora]|uniref:Phytanoyl-CoA dioxygenase n=1 Tax=Thamnocephalis sphaerospora TaxID=78915 RepID=A0A4P9XXF6_9FUNG|nr:hypothetical protein THASP1DRAFT_27157 [Thamnocephalis sphaerospora]|eukprot:RKP11058.1 hypothetical protein THASP1DRAFT_27157 [Thamnocephalis sphaerospora]
MIQFHDQGYLCIPGFLSAEEIERAKQRIQHHIDVWQPEEHPLVTFGMSPDKQARDAYFLTSGDKVRYFLEEDAVDANGQLCVSKACAINKIGHALHAHDPFFRQVTFGSHVKQIASMLGLDDPLVVQSMAILKQPRIGGEVLPHQDSTFLHTDPPSALGFWIPLEDCTPANGCLYAVPGSHRDYPVRNQFVRTDAGSTAFIGEPLPLIDASKYVPIQCPAGSLVLIHGAVVHRSDANRSLHSRWAYTFHLVEGNAAYSQRNWLQPTTELPFPRLFAG